MAKRDDVDSKSEPGSFSSSSRDQLVVPGSDDDLCDREKRGKLRKCPIKVSSQEFFSVSFDVLDDPGYEIVPAVRGHTIKEALGQMLERKGLDIATIAVYQDSALSPLPLTYDISKLGGCHLRVKAAKDCVNADAVPTSSSSTKVSSSNKLESQRKSAGSTRSLKGLLGLSSDESYGSFSGDSLSSVTGNVQGCQDGYWKMGKTRSQGKLSGLFSNPFKDKEKMELLTDLLNRYGQNGIPKLPYLIHFETEKEEEEIFYLEESWTQIVDNAKDLPDRTWQQQSAIWELLTTEISYLRKLKVIQDLFINCLCNLQNEKILNEVDIDKLFGNIQELYYTNLTLWKMCLLPMLNHSRTTRLPFDPRLMKDSFFKFDQLFHPYIKFFLEQNSCIHFLKELYQENEQFKAYLAWCESQKECNRQRLVDLLVKPMERLTKYALLLKVIHKRSDEDGQKKVLVDMIRCVEAFVSGVNSTLRQRHEQDRLANIINRIDSYEPVEIKDDEIDKVLKPYLELDLTSPMPGCAPQHSRQLLMEGDLKLKESSSGKIDVHCLLFTDMLLICKSLAKKGDRVKVIRPPYIIDRIEIHEMKDCSGVLLIYLNEYNVATSVYTLISNDIKIWLDAIRKAQEHFKEVKLSHPEVTLFVRDDDDFEFIPNGVSASKSPKGSGGSSLIHSHSGSVELSEPGSSTVNHSRATSLEFSEMRVSSASSDEGSTSDFPRAKLNTEEVRNNQPVSPRPERRIFLLKSTSGSSTPNTLSVGYPYSDNCNAKSSELSPTSLTIPSPKLVSPKSRSVTHPPQSPRILRRSFPVTQSTKPPLVKTKNVTNPSNVGAGDESSQCDDSQSCFDFGVPVITGFASNRSSTDSDDEDGANRFAGSFNRQLPTFRRRNALSDRRYHTADSIENMKAKSKETPIQKRLSWHFGQQPQQVTSTPLEKFCHPKLPVNTRKKGMVNAEMTAHESSNSETVQEKAPSKFLDLEPNFYCGKPYDGDSNVFPHFATAPPSPVPFHSPIPMPRSLCHLATAKADTPHLSSHIGPPKSFSSDSSCQKSLKAENSSASSVQITISDSGGSSCTELLEATTDKKDLTPHNMTFRASDV